MKPIRERLLQLRPVVIRRGKVKPPFAKPLKRQRTPVENAVRRGRAAVQRRTKRQNALRAVPYPMLKRRLLVVREQRKLLQPLHCNAVLPRP